MVTPATVLERVHFGVVLLKVTMFKKICRFHVKPHGAGVSFIYFHMLVSHVTFVYQRLGRPVKLMLNCVEYAGIYSRRVIGSILLILVVTCSVRLSVVH